MITYKKNYSTSSNLLQDAMFHLTNIDLDTIEDEKKAFKGVIDVYETLKLYHKYLNEPTNDNIKNELKNKFDSINWNSLSSYSTFIDQTFKKHMLINSIIKKIIQISQVFQTGDVLNFQDIPQSCFHFLQNSHNLTSKTHKKKFRMRGRKRINNETTILLRGGKQKTKTKTKKQKQKQKQKTKTKTKNKKTQKTKTKKQKTKNKKQKQKQKN